jgi:hypothetical protein
VVAEGAHDDDLLEVWDVDHLHVGRARLHAGRAGVVELVDLVLDDVVLVDVVRSRAVGHGWLHVLRVILHRRHAAGIRLIGIVRFFLLGDQSQLDVLLARPHVLGADELPRSVASRRLHPRIPRRIVDDNLKRQIAPLTPLLQLSRDPLDLIRDLLLPNPPMLPRRSPQIRRHRGEQALDARVLPARGRRLEVNVRQAQRGGVGAHDAAAQVGGGLDAEGVPRARGRDGPCRLDARVVRAAVRAGEGSDDDFAEAGDLGQQQARGALGKS